MENKNLINLEFITRLEKKIPKKNIVVVTKNQPIEAIKEAIKNNMLTIGESKIQEAEKKFLNNPIKEKIELHLIGHLQSNKTKKAVQLFDVIQSADSVKIIKKINTEAQKIKKNQRIFLQINIGKDPKKYGVEKKQIKEVCLYLKKTKNISLIGVMTILPNNIEKKRKENLFKETKKIQKQIQKEYHKKCKETSMGMSGDYKEALKQGATYVRIGTNIFKK